MTQDELDTLPEFYRFTMKEEMINGVRTVTPVVNPSGCCYWSDDDPILAQDRNGQWWRFTKVNGILHKIRD